jgi:hypothetical protein
MTELMNRRDRCEMIVVEALSAITTGGFIGVGVACVFIVGWLYLYG